MDIGNTKVLRRLRPNCPTRELCTKSKNCVKTVMRNIWKDCEELMDDAWYTTFYKRMYKLRKETIERMFADAKEKHAMHRYNLPHKARCRCRYVPIRS